MPRLGIRYHGGNGDSCWLRWILMGAFPHKKREHIRDVTAPALEMAYPGKDIPG